MSDYRFVERVPTVEEYNSVRLAAGLSAKDPQAARRGLRGSLYSVCIENKNRTVGIGRVIGDGGLFFDLVDIAVLPEHQGKGIGKMIMDGLMKYVRTHALPSAFVALMTKVETVPFYERYGFKVRGPNEPGMHQII